MARQPVVPVVLHVIACPGSCARRALDRIEKHLVASAAAAAVLLILRHSDWNV